MAMAGATQLVVRCDSGPGLRWWLAWFTGLMGKSAEKPGCFNQQLQGFPVDVPISPSAVSGIGCLVGLLVDTAVGQFSHRSIGFK